MTPTIARTSRHRRRPNSTSRPETLTRSMRTATASPARTCHREHFSNSASQHFRTDRLPEADSLVRVVGWSRRAKSGSSRIGYPVARYNLCNQGAKRDGCDGGLDEPGTEGRYGVHRGEAQGEDT